MPTYPQVGVATTNWKEQPLRESLDRQTVVLIRCQLASPRHIIRQDE